jgi:hypothetical protein
MGVCLKVSNNRLKPSNRCFVLFRDYRFDNVEKLALFLQRGIAEGTVSRFKNWAYSQLLQCTFGHQK